jgi:hypothetical protein
MPMDYCILYRTHGGKPPQRRDLGEPEAAAWMAGFTAVEIVSRLETLASRVF